MCCRDQVPLSEVPTTSKTALERRFYRKVTSITKFEPIWIESMVDQTLACLLVYFQNGNTEFGLGFLGTLGAGLRNWRKTRYAGVKIRKAIRRLRGYGWRRDASSLTEDWVVLKERQVSLAQQARPFPE